MFSYGFTKPLRLYTSYYLNDDIVDIERPNGICSHTFFVEKFSGLFLHPSIFSVIHSRSA